MVSWGLSSSLARPGSKGAWLRLTAASTVPAPLTAEGAGVHHYTEL